MDVGTRAPRMGRGMATGMAVAVALVLVGCGGPDGTNPGDSVLVGGTTGVELTEGAGFGPPIPTGVACTPWAAYELDLTTGGALSWTVCHVQGPSDDPASYVVDTGTRTLTSVERAQLSARIQAVHVTRNDNCGADKGAIQLTVDSPSGHRVYGDDFYSCLKMFDLYVDSQALDTLLQAMDDVRRQ